MHPVDLAYEREPQIARCDDGDGPDEEYRAAFTRADGKKFRLEPFGGPLSATENDAVEDRPKIQVGEDADPYGDQAPFGMTHVWEDKVGGDNDQRESNDAHADDG